MLVYDIKRKPRLTPSPKGGDFDFKEPATLFLLRLLKTPVIFGFWLTIFLAATKLVMAPQGAVFQNLSLPTVQAQADLNREELEKKLGEIESQITSYEVSIRETQAQAKTLKQQISILESKTKKLNLQIQATDLQIRRLSSQIKDTGAKVKESEEKIGQAKVLLEKSLQRIYENDQQSLLEVLLANAVLSDFFSEVSAQEAIQFETQKELEKIKNLKAILERQYEELLNQKEDQQALYQLQDAQRQELASEKKAKNDLLATTQGKESVYQQLLKQSQKTAAEIRVQLYRLLGGGELKFEDALKFAEFAAGETGVRPALLLAVLDKESDLGRNVGRCSWKTAMDPTRDQPVFLELTRELNVNPDTIPVSCPILKDGSYGGAIGIAQFLPSTWVLYAPRIEKIIGRPPSPWNPQDAFLASALYLADAGATAQTYNAERQAAAKYYAGRRWQYYLWSYGTRVMELASDYQNQINILRRTASL